MAGEVSATCSGTLHQHLSLQLHLPQQNHLPQFLRIPTRAHPKPSTYPSAAVLLLPKDARVIVTTHLLNPTLFTPAHLAKMGLIPISNHLALIRDCYPTKLMTTTPLSDLKPDSNALSKLCFYAVGRPKKLPKVAAVIADKAEKDARGSSANTKTIADLAITIDVMRGLVTECRSELQCFADKALIVAEAALTFRTGGRREPDIMAKGASLFTAVSTFSSGPFLGLDETISRQYKKCLSLLASAAQLSAESAGSRYIALSALGGAVTSEVLYASASDYDNLVHIIVPALLFNCVGRPVSELAEASRISDAESKLSPPGPVSSRKSPTIVPPNPTPTSESLAALATSILHNLCRLSQAVQLSLKLSASKTWLDKHQNGAMWADASFVEWLGASTVSASAVQYRAGVVTWWVEQVTEISGQTTSPKYNTIVDTLSAILRGPTSLVGLGIGGVLSQLVSLLVRRVPHGNSDPLTPRILSSISALATRSYYSDQVNDIVSDLVDAMRSVKRGGGDAAAFTESQRTHGLRLLVVALLNVLVEANKGSGEVQAAVPLTKSASVRSKKSIKSTKEGKETNGHDATVKASNGAKRPSLNGNETIKGNGVHLGGGEGLRSKKEAGGEGVTDALGRPVMRVTSTGARHRVSPEVFQESLFLLTETDSVLRHDYEQALLLYLRDEMDAATVDPTRDTSKFFSDLHVAMYDLATSSLSPNSARSPSISVTSSPNARSRRSSKSSLRRQSNSQTLLNGLATPSDYAALREIIVALQSRVEPLAVLHGVPMLLSLQKEAEKWAEGIMSAEKVQACREIVASGLETIGAAWGIADVENMGRKALSSLGSSVIPAFDPDDHVTRFAPRSKSTEVVLDSATVANSVASSIPLQQTLGQDRNTLFTHLIVEWTAEEARSRYQPASVVYSGSASRSVVNLSGLRISRTPDRARSIRAPSLADLQTSLGRAVSVRGSATPSIASTSGTMNTYDTRRRTSRTKEAVLAALSNKSITRLSVGPQE